MKRSLFAAVAVACALAGCSPEPAEVVEETTANLEEIQSGHLQLVVRVASPESEAGGQAGFELSGSFQLPEEGALPVADIEYTDLASEEPATQGFLSTGDAAFIVVDEQAYEIPDEQATILRGGTEGEGLFDQLHVADWIQDPELSEGEARSGEAVDRVTGELDVVEAINDMVLTAQRFGRSDLAAIEGAEEQRLENAVRSSRIELLTGSEDRLLRRLSLEIEFAVDESLDLAEVLGPLAGATFELDLEISEPNEPIEVAPPADPLPLDQLEPSP